MHVAKEYIIAVVFEHSFGYIIFVTCINILLVKFEVIYQQAFAHNTHGLFHHKQVGWINCMPRIAHCQKVMR